MKSQARWRDRKGRAQWWQRRASSKTRASVTIDGRNGAHCCSNYVTGAAAAMTAKAAATTLTTAATQQQRQGGGGSVDGGGGMGSCGWVGEWVSDHLHYPTFIFLPT